MHNNFFRRNVMKIRQTLFFMFKNPTPIFLYFLFCWILFSALTTIADDPFIHGTLSDASDEVRESTKNLPWSLWKYCTALSHMVEEIAHDFSHIGFLFAIVPALFIGFLEAAGSIKGIGKQREVWMKWFYRQKELIEQSDTSETSLMIDSGRNASIPELSKDTTQSMLFFPMNLILHFGYWVVVLAFISIIMQIDKGISDSLLLFIKFLPQFLIPSAILALISCYRQTRGYNKGCIAEHQVWTNWYNRQKDILENGKNIEDPPSTTEVVSESYYKKYTDPVILMLRKPKQMIIQFLVWNIVGLIIIFTLSGIYGGLTYFPPISLIASVTFQFCSIPAALFTIIISYREAKGNLTGMDSEQQVWNSWYTQQQVTQELESDVTLPTTEETESDTYLFAAKKTCLAIARKPQKYLIHLFCWLIGFVFVYGITNIIALEVLPDHIQILLVISLAFISIYQEVRGNQKGKNNQRQSWVDWYDQHYQDADKESEFIQTPPMLEVY